MAREHGGNGLVAKMSPLVIGITAWKIYKVVLVIAGYGASRIGLLWEGCGCL